MIIDSTYTDKSHKKIISDLVGSAFSLVKSIKMKGVGSKRMIIENVSPNMQQYLNLVSGINYANIEMRPNGILLYINKGLKTFTWVIPYYHLVFYKTTGVSIHAQGKFIHFRSNITSKENKDFLDKLLKEKVKFDEQYNFQNL